MFQVFINPAGPKFKTSAAKLTFFDLAGAISFYQVTRGGFALGTCQAKVVRNRIRVAEQTGLASSRSRVVVVRGPKEHVTLSKLQALLDGELQFYDAQWVEEPEEPTPSQAVIEICFGSYRAQTEAAWVVLCKTLVHKGVHISFGADPCA